MPTISIEDIVLRCGDKAVTIDHGLLNLHESRGLKSWDIYSDDIDVEVHGELVGLLIEGSGTITFSMGGSNYSGQAFIRRHVPGGSVSIEGSGPLKQE